MWQSCIVQIAWEIQLEPLIQTRLFWIPHYFKLKTTSLGFALQSFTLGYFDLPLFRSVFRFPCEYEIAGFSCISSWVEYNRKVKQRRGQRLVKKWIYNLPAKFATVSRFVNSSNGSKNVLRLNMQWQRSIPNGNTKTQPSSFAFLRQRRTWSFHVLVAEDDKEMYKDL